jgi:type VI secretion system FHA domain protein
MALRLRVVSEQKRLLGDRCAIVFGEGGGTIGRSSDNDWILPDPLRYISAHHARVHFRQGHFYLEDLSTNGSYVNDEESPIGRKGGPCRLSHGDMLRFGEYHVIVAVDATPQTEDETPGEVSVRSAAPASQHDLGAALNLDDLLVADSSPSDNFGPVDAYGQRTSAPQRTDEDSEISPAAAYESLIDDDAEGIAKRIERLAKAAARKNGTAGPQLYDVHTGLQAFCRGAGIDADSLPGDAQTRLLHLAGQLFREVLLGVKDIHRLQHEERNRFRIELPTDPEDSKPDLTRAALEDLLIEVLKAHESRRIDAVQWLRETLAAVKNHERATAEATRSAFVEFIDRLDPTELETRFERATRRGKAKSQNWELYADFYRNLTEMPADHLPHTFVEAFAAAYRRVFDKSK